MKRLFLAILIIGAVQSAGAYNMKELGDSLDAWAGFNLGCVPKVKVTQVKSNKDLLWVYTNKVLSCLSLSPAQVTELRRKVSIWVFGNTRGKVTIYSDGFEIGELITDRYKSRPQAQRYPIPNKGQLGQSLNGQYIALWPSHGVYYNRDENRWKLQRATMWTTVEDLYSTAYAEQISRALERAGATVIWPRARYGKDEAAAQIGPSGYPRWAEGARYWLEYQGVPDSVWNPVTDKNDPLKDSVRNDYLDDLRCRGLWVNWLSGGSVVNPNQAGQHIPVTACLAVHTDGYSQEGDSLIIGTLAIYSRQDNNHRTVFANGCDRLLNRDLADYVQTQVVADIQRKYAPNWKRRQLQNAGYAESRYPVIPTLLLEILSHKQFADIRYGMQPAFRKDVARAIYKGVGRWIHAQTGTEFIVQPLPVHDMAVRLDNDVLHVSWTATTDSLEAGAAPNYYIVEVRENGGTWQQSARVKSDRYSFNAKQGVRYDIRVTAGNNGGTSEPSEIITACRNIADRPTVLIINAFNRTDGPEWFADSLNAGIRSYSTAIADGEDGIYIGEQWEFNRALDWISDDDCGWGMCYRDRTGMRQVGNTHDYTVLHGKVLQQLGYSFVSTNSSALDSINGDYALVDLICGREHKNAVPAFGTTGIPTLVSGAYLGAIPRASRTGEVCYEGITCHLATQPNPKRLNCPDPTGQIARKNQQTVAYFKDSGVPVAVLDGNCLTWSIPLEACDEFEQIYRKSIETILK